MSDQIKPHFKSVFLSDLHIGTKACKIKQLNEFLSSFTCDQLYLVGDIIDGWAIAKGNSHFPQDHVNAIRKFLTKAKNKTHIYYVIGNHDEFLRKYTDIIQSFGNVSFSNEFLHHTKDGKKFLVTHGDMYDTVTRHHRWVAQLGDSLYTILVEINSILNWIRAKFGLRYWSLAGYLKSQVKGALEFIYSFEQTVAFEAKKHGFDGVICGHIHVAADKQLNDLRYLNCGDGVESCTAIFELHTGELDVLQWKDIVSARS